MGFRFRRSIRIAPGLRLNLSKSGGSLSIGGRGSTVNLSSRGVRTTVGLPGTGLSYTVSSSSGRSRRSHPPTRRQLEAQWRAAHREASREAALARVAAEQAELDDLVEQWRDVPALPSAAEYASEAIPKPFVFEQDPPPVPDPTEEHTKLTAAVRARWREVYGSEAGRSSITMGVGLALSGAIATSVGLGAWWAGSGAVARTLGIGSFVLGAAATTLVACIRRARRETELEEGVRRELESRWEATWMDVQAAYLEAVRAWETSRDEARDAHDQAEELRVAAVKRLLSGDPEAMAEAIERELADQSFPFEALCQVAVVSREEAYVLLDLPEIEDVIPPTETRVLKSGATSEKKRSTRDRQELYARLVCGLAHQVMRIAFSVAPTLQVLHLAAHTQRRGRDGRIEDEFVLELNQTRAENAAFDYESGDPVAAVGAGAGNRIRLTKTSKLGKLSEPAWMRETVV